MEICISFWLLGWIGGFLVRLTEVYYAKQSFSWKWVIGQSALLFIAWPYFLTAD